MYLLVVIVHEQSAASAVASHVADDSEELISTAFSAFLSKITRLFSHPDPAMEFEEAEVNMASLASSR